MKPEDKVRIHQEIFHLVYNSNGGFTHDEVYAMPIFLRYFYLKMLIEQKAKEKEQTDEPPKPNVTPKPPNRPVIKKPF